MSERDNRIEALLQRGESEREDVAMAIVDTREEIERRRAQWKAASAIATALAIAATVVYKLFGKASLAGKLSRAASVLSLVLGLARGARRLRRFW